MRLLVITPAPAGSTKGNRITAERWSGFLRELGHEVCIAEGVESGNFDALIALHATRSHEAILNFVNRFPHRPVILCLTGTDLHADLQQRSSQVAYERATESLKCATQIVLLEPAGIQQLPREYRGNVSVVLQSALPVSPCPPAKTNCFEISVVGHLRDEKDPFLAAQAARLLPDVSKISITHVGAALQPEMEKIANDEMNSSDRYQWRSAVSHQQAQEVIARSQLMVLTSKLEGAPSAISEAIVNMVPILATRIPATIGLLGEDYPGLFPVGDANRLAELMWHSETDASFVGSLRTWIDQLSSHFKPSAELAALKALLKSVQQS